MRHLTWIALLAAVGVFAAGCADEATPAVPAQSATEAPPPAVPPLGADLNGTRWILSMLNAKPVMTGMAVTLAFEAITLGGSDGCNRYNGSYVADGTNIAVKQPMASTMMACAEPVMAQAAAYQAALGSAATYEIYRDRLTLRDSNGGATLVFDPQPTSLDGTSWTVLSYNNGQQAVISVIAGTILTANFSKDGSLSGFAGCNDFVGSYESDGKASVSVGQLATTRKMCAEPAGVMDQEAQYVAALQTAARYKIEGHTLELRSAEDTIAATFLESAAGTASP